MRVSEERATTVSPGRKAPGESRHPEGRPGARADDMSGTDATCPLMTRAGQATVFIVVDHVTAECAGIHAAWVRTRFDAPEPLRQGVKGRFDAYSRGVATGLGPPPRQRQPVHLEGISGRTSLPGCRQPVLRHSPEGNGCAERFVCTREEKLLWGRTFSTVEDLRVPAGVAPPQQQVRTYGRPRPPLAESGPAGVDAVETGGLITTHLVSQQPGAVHALELLAKTASTLEPIPRPCPS